MSINIYKELTTASKNDNMLNDSLEKIRGNGYINAWKREITFPEGDKNFRHDAHDIMADLTAHKQNEPDAYYCVTENDRRYVPIRNIIKMIGSDQLCIIIKKIINLLVHMNERYGFIHWNLNLDNLLINSLDGTSIKINNFDLSSTKNFQMTNF